MVEIGSGAHRELPDLRLSRYTYFLSDHPPFVVSLSNHELPFDKLRANGVARLLEPDNI